MKEKKAVTREYQTRYLKASKKEKKKLLDEFTKLTGYHRKSAVRILYVKGETAEKLTRISSATIDRYLKKDKEALRLKGKSLTKPMDSLKSRIPIRTFYINRERKKPWFWQIDAADFSPTPLRTGLFGPVCACFNRHRRRLRLD